MPLNYKPKKEDRKRYEDRDGLTLAEVVELAVAKTGWSQSRVAKYIGIDARIMKQWKHRGVRTSTEIPRLLNLARLAGLSDPQAIVIILRHMIPVELGELKQYVGCTVRLYRRKNRPPQKRNAKVAEMHARIAEALPRAR